MYIRRALEQQIIDVSNQFPVLLVHGARQAGKTTLLRHLCGNNRKYISLDDPVRARAAREDPALFIDQYEPPVLIDEIQYAPELLPHIKMKADREKQKGAYWLTGSQPLQLMNNVSESLAGRVGIFSLFGLSRREVEARDTEPFLPLPEQFRNRVERAASLSVSDIYRIIWQGSYPAIVSGEVTSTQLFFSSYIQTYLERDVRALTNIGDLLGFQKFMRAAAARTAQQLNLSELARDADVSVPTARRWLSVLESSGIVYLLQPYHSNVTKRLVKTPKLYFLDTGLAAHLTEWTSPETLAAGAMSGAMFETWVAGEILKSWYHAGRRPNFHYYRDKDKKEIDLLIFSDGLAYPVEIKKTASPSRNHVRQFGVLEKRAELRSGPGALICMYKDVLALGENIWAIPGTAL